MTAGLDQRTAAALLVSDVRSGVNSRSCCIDTHASALIAMFSGLGQEKPADVSRTAGIVGGGTCGLATAMLLARAGFEVTVIERDAEEPPPVGEDVFTCWKRRGVPQFHQAHFVQSRFRILIQRELPDVYEALVAAGGTRFDMLAAMPPFIADRTPREVDERLWTMTARRPVLESVFARAAQDEPRLDLRRGEASRRAGHEWFGDRRRASCEGRADVLRRGAACRSRH
jgi:2-polyprenyl-6-methoxyphenol hydroxylase-like FAD-dependent oxidoreductase